MISIIRIYTFRSFIKYISSFSFQHFISFLGVVCVYVHLGSAKTSQFELRFYLLIPIQFTGDEILQILSGIFICSS